MNKNKKGSKNMSNSDTLFAKRSAAAKKAWATIRANKLFAKRSAAAKKAWATRRASK